RNVVEDVPPFPESRTARGSVSAAYRLSFDEVFCGLSNEERKKVYGRLFGKQVLAHIHSRCQRDADIIREKALRRISRECGAEIDCALLLNKMVDILQNARLTINFNAAKID
ncbi:type III secretion system effector SopF, partial [Salmonella enterica subsp. enterica serovar Anatum]